MLLEARPHGPLGGAIVVPGDKSISHRALLFAALAAGRSRIRGLLEAEDVQATARALAALGIEIATGEGGIVEVCGVGTAGLAEPEDILDCGNAGTLARLLLGVLAGHPFRVALTGDPSLRRRPMGRVCVPLRAMGARIEAREGDRLPLTIAGRLQPIPLAWRSQVASAQVKTALLLAGLHAPGETSVVEPAPSRDHSERMLRAMGAAVETHAEAGGAQRVTIRGHAELTPISLEIPGDPSSAAFPLVAALLAPGSELVIREVGLNPHRTGLVVTLREMGAEIEIGGRRERGGEPVGDLHIRSSRLRAVEVPAARAPSMIDEYPILAVAAALAQGTTVMRGLAELRVKESDRLAAILAGLTACGVEAHVEGEDLFVRGTAGRPPRGGAVIDARLDHRIAMSFLVLGGVAEKPVCVRGAEAIATSFPGFVETMNGIGCDIRTVEEEA